MFAAPVYYAAGAAGFALMMLRYFAADVYDIVIVKMTTKWYAFVLNRISSKQKVLDIGIGTASALIENKDILEKKDIQIVGVDYEQSYITKAKHLAAKHHLQNRISLHCDSVYTSDLASYGAPFDVAYFSGSISLMPDPPKALRAVAKVLKPQGLIYVTQTYQQRYTPLLGYIKPLMGYVTTIDFGKLTYEADLKRIVADAGMRIVENTAIPGSVDNYFQCAKFVMINPEKEQ
ncbi:hypothetical protein CYMTET_15540 [Cymbomonas tetramitiformis]|uniref:Methyltransferase domain-containing protein n=1 Tax=Cymbomonas tetramitiformis TaxID=36881 RepID=A0AAE0L920_9CHLO|nr:hypothetical protein CYMTET_15540 [Cymbomonas tetramitiformis]|eukprot:gene5476-6638_t